MEITKSTDIPIKKKKIIKSSKLKGKGNMVGKPANETAYKKQRYFVVK